VFGGLDEFWLFLFICVFRCWISWFFVCFGFVVGLFVREGIVLLFLWLGLFFGLCCFVGFVVVVLFFCGYHFDFSF
jgi:hypothetical protein